jgi:DNA-directed RNA polymerase subunit K/omega
MTDEKKERAAKDDPALKAEGPESEAPAEGGGTPETIEAVEPEREITEPRSKYERIMMAAAEATRLNEEIRRKGTKLDRKVTLEALKRVDEGKVKAVLGGKGLVAGPRPPRPEPTVDTLFMSPPLLADADLGDEETEEPAEKD